MLLRLSTGILMALLVTGFATADDQKADKPFDQPISYYKQIRPIFQAHCQGCHQPAKARGDYVMTTFDRLLKGGSSGLEAIIPGNPDESNLVYMITPEDGKAQMPEGKKPLAESDIELIKRWIAEGAKDDTPANAVARYDLKHPPIYTRPPVVTSLDFSPDGKLLAVSGFHEVLLVDPKNGQLVARLIGLSERIQSLRFSPDGKSLAVSGGLPGRMGEVQIWDVAKRRLRLSVPVTYDTIYGISWSPDGSRVAFGCSDNTVRAIDVQTGDEVLFMGSHTDWVLDTEFSVDGSHLVSVGRDMTAKLTEVATQRFVDNITSITPGVLRGGIQSVARHPKRDEIVVGGSDGVVKVYRIHRLTKRVIGDDANLIRRMPPMRGRVFSVAVSRDGSRIAAGSSLDGAGELHIYGYEFDTSLPPQIKRISEKVITTRSAQEHKALEEYRTKDVQLIARVELPSAAIYAVAFAPDGKLVAAAGSDGTIRLFETVRGNLVRQFTPAPLAKPDQVAGKSESDSESLDRRPIHRPEAELQLAEPERDRLAKGTRIVKLSVEPREISLHGPFQYAQVVVMAELASGDVIDVTRTARFRFTGGMADVSPAGLVRPTANGRGEMVIDLAGHEVRIPVAVAGVDEVKPVDFVRDVAPVLSRIGCNAGTCHGAAKGKNGFKLSLRGYDPVLDVRALTDDLAGRRVNIASPDDSLMLLKTTGAVPHVGGSLTRPGEPYYEIIRNWIAHGAKLNPESPRVVRIDISPTNPVIQRIGQRQQMRVVATYADGTTRDVTREAYIESGNSEVAAAEVGGLLTSLRRGEAPVLARFEGAYAATTLTVMGDRTGFVWHDPPAFNRIDELVAAKWKRMKIQPSPLCSDAEFLRRVYLDLTGLPPTADELRAFLADQRDTRTKRDEVIDRLVGSPEYVEHWTNKWADLLQVNRKFLGVEGAKAFRQWIRNAVAQNLPYDKFAWEILTAAGSNLDNPAASYFKILRDPAAIMENTTHLFLAVRFNCNKCHDHPFERWTQDQYYQTAAFFARVGLQRDPRSGNRYVGGTAVEGRKPLYEIIVDRPTGEIKHLRTGEVTAPKFPYDTDFHVPKDVSRREALAAWLTSPDNPYFAKSYVNRLWGYLFGVGIIDPIDDIRAGNPPSNPELLDYLTQEFINSGFDIQHMIRLICKSRTYQLSIATNKWNEDDHINYSHAMARRLPAEVLLDSVYRVTGSLSKFPGVPRGTRAAELPDVGVALPTGFLAKFGRPARESACECERSSNLQLGPIMALVNGPTVAEAIADPNNAIARLVREITDDRQLINELFLRILNRPATEKEIAAALETMQQIDADHQQLVEAMKAREKLVRDMRPKLEQQRRQTLAKAKAEAAAYEKKIAPRVAELERKKAEKTKNLEAELKKYEASLPQRLKEWEKRHASSVQWVRLDPKVLSASNKAKLTKQADLSIVASGKNGKGVYTIVAETDLKNITGLRLEVLPQKGLPNNGPGRAKDGNFVLNEITVEAAPKSDPKRIVSVDLHKPLSDYSQDGFPIAKVLDGAKANVNGWAIAGAIGLVHWATFETKKPIGYEGGTRLTIKLYHRFTRPNFSLGRFRLSVTTAKTPIGLSLADDLKAIIDTPEDKRSPEQRAALMKYFRGVDKELKKKRRALAESKKPLPIDPRLKELRDTVAQLEQPLPEDEVLTQLRRDVAMSEKQRHQKRLTAAQDLAWALINSPAFLFNH